MPPMRKKIILHIGASKAGSSSIQAFLRRNRFVFAKHGYVIPDKSLSIGGPVTGEHVFAVQAMNRPGDAKTFRDRMDALFAQSTPETHSVLISAENLSNLGNSAIIAGLSEHYDVKIVMYLRRQDELLTSAWQQWASKIESDFHGWLITALKQYGQWDRVLAEWANHAGAAGMVVRVFDRASFLHGDLLQDFVDAIGLGGKSGDFDFVQEDSNPSVSDAITAMVAGNRKLFEDVHDNRLYNALADLTGNALVEKTKVSLLTQIQRDKVLEYYRPINEGVCRQYFPGRQRLFPPVDHAKYRYLTNDQMVDEKFRIIMTIISALVQKEA